MNLFAPRSILLLAEIIILDLEDKVKTPTQETRNFVAQELKNLSIEEVEGICKYFNSSEYLGKSS